MLTNRFWVMKLLNFSAFLLYLCLSTFFLLEVIFRFLPVSDSLKVQPVNQENPVLHFQSNNLLTRQTGFNFKHIVKKRINNYGYATDTFFEGKVGIHSNLVGIVGDSFVEASQVSNEDSFHGRLSLQNPGINFYPLGISGSPLSQYLVFTKFISENFAPDGYIFIIIENDFDESWLRYKNNPGFHYFSEDQQLIRVDLEHNSIKSFLRESAFIRYLYLDLKIQVQLSRIVEKYFQGESNILDEQIAFNDSQKILRAEYSLRAVELFLHKLESLVSGKPVLLVLDGDRKAIYSGNRKRNMDRVSNLAFEHMKDQSQKFKNITVLDMHSIFYQEWLLNNKKFNFSYDMHWNRVGHLHVAEAIKRSDFLNFLNSDE